MEKNIGKLDKVIRLILGVIFIVLGIIYTKWWFLLAVILIVTAAISFCGLYKIFGISTCKVEPKDTKEEK